jgi:hypothetical protein
VRRLRAELKREVTRALAVIERGREIDDVLKADGRFSALACLIVALRAGRGDLVDGFSGGAAAQHRACPLYRRASEALLPSEFYPVESRSAVQQMEYHFEPRVEKLLLSLN